MLIDDFSSDDLTSAFGTTWQGVSDRVMGGVSTANLTRDNVDGVFCLRLGGEVRLENNGGFLQAALDLTVAGETLDASEYSGLRLTVMGNEEEYSVHLRTPDNIRSWQSYRATFHAGPNWETIDLPFDEFLPHRLEVPLDTSRIRRVGLVAIGRAFLADFRVARVSLYR